jgi:proteasome-associated ATPase
MNTATNNTANLQTLLAQQRKANEEIPVKLDRILAQVRSTPEASVFSMAAQQISAEVNKLDPLGKQAAMTHLVATIGKNTNEYARRVAEENKRLKTPPNKVAVFDGLQYENEEQPVATIRTTDGILEVPVSTEVDCDELILGHRVVLAQNGAIIKVRDFANANPCCEFDRLIKDNNKMLVRINDKLGILSIGGDLAKNNGLETLRSGDLIEYDPYTLTSLRVAFRSAQTREFTGEIPDVTREDIGGLDEIWNQIEKEVIFPIRKPELYRKYKIEPPRGILFHGVPGVGKTMLIKATARAILKELGLDEKAPIIFSVSGSSLLRPYVGEGSGIIRAIAKNAEEASKTYGFSCVLLDDFEYGGGLHRGLGDRSSPAYSSLTASLITTMDGLSDRDIRVTWCATCNRVDLVDSAVIRRFSTKIEVKRPGFEACQQILKIYLRELPLAAGLTVESLAEQVAAQIFSTENDNILLNLQYVDAEKEEIFPPRIINGAMLADTVRAASLKAVEKDRGVSTNDMLVSLKNKLNSAVSMITPANAHMHFLGLPSDRQVVSVDHNHLLEEEQEIFVN